MQSSKIKSIYKAIMLVILTAIITYLITSICMNNNNSNSKYVGDNTNTIKDGVVLDDKLIPTINVLNKYIDEKYLYDTDEKEKDMMVSAIKGYVDGLGDEYSEYISEQEMKGYLEDTLGKYVGIGVYLVNDKEKNQVVVLMPIKGSPAEEAGIIAGDVISKVDGVSYTGEQLSEASSALKKEEGTFAEVEIIREGDVINLSVERRKIKVNHVESQIINQNIGYIDISTFDEGTYDEFVQNWQKLKEQNVKSLIIDLRSNGGGIVQEALEIADLMVDKDKTLLITTGKKEKEKITKSKIDKEIDVPVVILINESTASSSEILAAAVRENNDNVTLVGKTTYGKGIIQTIFALYDGSGLKLTTNEYFTPNRNSIHKVGIKPDNEVELPEGKSFYTIKKDEDTQLQKAIELLK